jgi:2-polyprenyl-6-methoxyphenol hydroxylase-like FAD-dependent oxidoreductase
MLALLLARAGVPVVVLEKHADFLRDFRGDTVHPSTLELLHELGLLREFLARPHDEVRELGAVIGDTPLVLADFARLRTQCKFIAMMPQWEFLDFLRDEAVKYPGMRLLMQAEATGVVSREGRITGLQVRTPQGELQVRADLVIGADGRHSAVRAAAGLVVHDIGAPIDVLWMRIPKHPSDPTTTGGRITAGRFLAMINRGDYWQCAYVIRKGGIAALQARGLAAFRADLAATAPLFADRVDAALPDWEAVKLLSVRVDRLEQWWRPGLLCIGDAAHAMSPVGGVGIHLAIQDAVAAANTLAAPLADARVTADALTPLLATVQRRRLFPTRLTQAAQVAVQQRILGPVLDSQAPLAVPWPLRLMNRWRVLATIPAYLVGVGVRPEHVRSPLARQGTPA